MNRQARRIAAAQQRHAKLVMHPLVAETALAFAHEVYGEMAKDNTWYAQNPDEAAWCKAMVPVLLPQARATLAQMLTMVSVSEAQKEEIYDALTKDGSLPRHLGLQ